MSGNVESSSVFKERSTKSKWYSVPKRYVQAILGFLALFIVFWMRTSFFAALFHVSTSEGDHADEREIPWTYTEIYLIDSAFTWGFTVAQIPGALLTLMYSSHRVLLVSMAVAIFFHTIIPFVLLSNAAWLIIIRLLQGIAEGLLFPAAIGMWKSWAPPSERTRLFCVVLCGSFFGSVAGMPLNMVLASNFGVKACFFISSTSGFIWCLVWALQMHESPSSHPYISDSELTYLEENTDVDPKLEITVKSVPWKSILTSLPVWTICLASICYSTNQYVLQLSPYLYLKIEFEIEKNHIILDAVLPDIILGAVVFSSGFIADILVNVVRLPKTLVRKIFCCGAFILHGVTLLVVRYYKDVESTVIWINLAHGFLGLCIAGFWVNCLDLSPYYAAVLMALCQTFGSLSEVILPAVLSTLLKVDIFQWSHLFDALITMSFAAAVVYACFGSGNVQWWGKPGTVQTNAATDETVRSTYYAYPDAEDCIELVGNGEQFCQTPA